MFTARRFRLIALAALSAFTFAQAAVAAMGCAAMRLENGHAVMPSGEPCGMLPDMPGPLSLKHCMQDEGQSTPFSPLLFTGLPVLPLLGIEPVLVQNAAAALAHARETQRILGPPPLLLTRRVLI